MPPNAAKTLAIYASVSEKICFVALFDVRPENINSDALNSLSTIILSKTIKRQNLPKF